MRVFIGGIATETNSFSPVLADCAMFRRGYWYVGAEMEAIKSTTMDGQGAYAYLETQPDVEIVPGFAAYCVTAGPCKAADFQEMSELLFARLRVAGQVDGVLLLLHGAMQTEGCMDPEGYILEQVRAIVGDVPVAACYDLHCCLTRKMAALMDSIGTYHTYPHTDHNKAGYRAAEALVRVIRTQVKPRLLYRYLPMIMPVENCNTETGPIVWAMERLKALLAQPAVFSAGLCLTQPWLDVPELGCAMCVYLTPDADPAPYARSMDEILDYIWEKREEFMVQVPSMEEALRMSAGMEKPCCIVELGDIVSAGGVGDSTVALRALLQAPQESACLLITDPDTVHKALETDIGNTGCFRIGGAETGYNQRVEVEARVIRASAEPYANLGATQKGVLTNGGMRVLLQAGDLFIIVSEYAYIGHDRNALASMGVDPAVMDVIIQKTHQMFKAGFAGVMKSFLYADTPGYTDRNLKRLPFQNVTRPIYPLDA